MPPQHETESERMMPYCSTLQAIHTSTLSQQRLSHTQLAWFVRLQQVEISRE
jgi:acyl-ACP thioesterase